MRRIIYGASVANDDLGNWTTTELCQWAANTIGAGGGFAVDAHAMGIEINGEMAAVTIWNCFEQYNCLMSIASDCSKRWMTREFLYRSFYYPFVQLGLPRVTVKLDEGNTESLKLGEHLGFKFEGRLRKAAPDGRDDIVMGLLKEECRWISDRLRTHAMKYSTVEG